MDDELKATLEEAVPELTLLPIIRVLPLKKLASAANGAAGGMATAQNLTSASSQSTTYHQIIASIPTSLIHQPCLPPISHEKRIRDSLPAHFGLHEGSHNEAEGRDLPLG